MSVVLPEPVAPTRATVSPGRDVQVDAAQQSGGRPARRRTGSGRRSNRSRPRRGGRRHAACSGEVTVERRVQHLEEPVGGAGRLLGHRQQPAERLDRPAQAQRDAEERDQGAGGQRRRRRPAAMPSTRMSAERDLGQREDHRPELGDHLGLAAARWPRSSRACAQERAGRGARCGRTP